MISVNTTRIHYMSDNMTTYDLGTHVCTPNAAVRWRFYDLFHIGPLSSISVFLQVLLRFDPNPNPNHTPNANANPNPNPNPDTNLDPNPDPHPHPNPNSPDPEPNPYSSSNPNPSF